MDRVNILEELHKKGIASEHAVTLAKKINEKDIGASLSLFSSFAYLGLKQFEIPKETLSEITKYLPQHPYFLIKFISLYNKRVLEEIYEHSPISEQAFKTRENFEDENRTITEFYSELVNIMPALEDKLLGKVYEKTLADDEYVGILATKYRIDNAMLTLMDKNDLNSVIRKNIKKEGFVSIAKPILDEINRQVIVACLGYAAQQKMPISKEDLTKTLESTCSDLKTGLESDKGKDLLLNRSLGVIIDHTRTEYVQQLLDPSYGAA